MNMFKSRAISLIQHQEIIALTNRIKIQNHKSTWVELSRVDPETVETVEIYVTADGLAYLTATFTDGSMSVPEPDADYDPNVLNRWLLRAKLLKH